MNSIVQRTECPPSDYAIWEAGHYYEAKGPTIWASLGWDVMQGLMNPSRNAHSMLFIDDVHPIGEVSSHERDMPCVQFNPLPAPEHIVLESEVKDETADVLERLKLLPRRRRARWTWNPSRWSCSGFSLTNTKEEPLCLLYDLALTLRKYNLGYRRGINVLPEFYASQQRPLLQIANKLLPDFTLSTVLFNKNGSLRTLKQRKS